MSSINLKYPELGKTIGGEVAKLQESQVSPSQHVNQDQFDELQARLASLEEKIKTQEAKITSLEDGKATSDKSIRNHIARHSIDLELYEKQQNRLDMANEDINKLKSEKSALCAGMTDFTAKCDRWATKKELSLKPTTEYRR